MASVGLHGIGSGRAAVTLFPEPPEARHLSMYFRLLGFKECRVLDSTTFRGTGLGFGIQGLSN